MEFDINSLDQAIDTLDTATKITNTTLGIIDKIKGLFQSTEPISQADLKILIADLTLQIADAKLSNASLKEQLAAVKEQLISTHNQHEKFEGYQPYKTQAGHIVYRYESLSDTGQESYFICPSCYDKNQKSFLQGDDEAGFCPVCKTNFDYTRQDQWRG